MDDEIRDPHGLLFRYPGLGPALRDWAGGMIPAGAERRFVQVYPEDPSAPGHLKARASWAVGPAADGRVACQHGDASIVFRFEPRKPD